jgi:spore coat protein A
LPDALSTIERRREEDAVRVRRLRLVRGLDESGRARLLLDGKRWSDAISEIMQLGQLEIWELTNTTGENHPIHLHLEAFQVLDRRDVSGAALPLEPQDLGWEDTFVVPNGQVVRFLVQYDKFAGTFVWHCHILEHEDHEMMRPLQVEVPEPAAGYGLAVAGAWLAAWRRRAMMRATEPV